MMSESRYSSKPLASDAARDLVVRIEHQGVDTDRITVETPTQGPEARTDAMDSALQEPLGRVIAGLAAGVMVGLIIGLGVVATTSASAVAVAIAAIMGGVIGLLVALYWKLPMNPAISQVDGADVAIVTVDLRDLDAGTAERVIARVDLA